MPILSALSRWGLSSPTAEGYFPWTGTTCGVMACLLLVLDRAMETENNENSSAERTNGVPGADRLGGIREENRAKRKGEVYSQETRDVARGLWLAGWSDARIAQTLGVARRATVTELASKENWHAIRLDYQKRVVEETNARAAESQAKANAQYLTQIRGTIAIMLKDLTERTKSGELTLRSLERAAFALARLTDTAREIEGLRQPDGSVLLVGQMNVQNNVAVANFQEQLQAVRGDPARVKELIEIQRERFLLDARLRTLMTEQPVVITDTESGQYAGDTSVENS